MAIRQGRKAPDFTLHDAEGKEVSLSDYSGKDVILYFYPADDTPGCTKEACAFRDGWSDLKSLGAVVLGVSPDDAASHRSFAKKYRLPFTLLSDPDKRVMKSYGAWGKKVLYGRPMIGVIRSTVWVGPDGKVRKHWARIPDAGKHPDVVLAALQKSSVDS